MIRFLWQMLIGGQSLPLQFCLWVGSLTGLAVAPVLGFEPQMIAKPAADPPAYVRPDIQCPNRLELLVPLLLRDLPSYVNRVSQRDYDAYRIRRQLDQLPGYVLLAGRPEYEPLSLQAGEYGSVTEDQVPQVFFTTLERKYFSGQAYRLQNYHWLFLTQTESGWRFVSMRSSAGDEPLSDSLLSGDLLRHDPVALLVDDPPTPPRDSSEGAIAEAIRLWLRDCEAGSIAGP
jgi:hypothetical protein